MEQGLIRDDLYYRLSVISIEIDPLRERPEDLLLLAEHFIRYYSPVYGAGEVCMTEAFKKFLLSHDWPGNTRELQHAIESAFVMLEPGECLDVIHLPPHLKRRYFSKLKAKDASSEAKAAEESHLKEYLARIERERIVESLEKNDWNISKVAREIGYSRSNLQYRMKKLGISGESGEE